MSLNKIWVFGETNAVGVATITLEMLAKARELADTVEVFLGGDGTGHAAQLGEHGASAVHARRPQRRDAGVSVASAVAAAVASGRG